MKNLLLSLCLLFSFQTSAMSPKKEADSLHISDNSVFGEVADRLYMSAGSCDSIAEEDTPPSVNTSYDFYLDESKKIKTD